MTKPVGCGTLALMVNQPGILLLVSQTRRPLTAGCIAAPKEVIMPTQKPIGDVSTKAMIVADVMNGVALVPAIKNAKISFGTHYRWCQDDPVYDRAIKDARDIFHKRIVEHAENAFLQQIDKGQWRAIRYALEKHRRDVYGAEAKTTELDLAKLKKALAIMDALEDMDDEPDPADEGG